MPFTARPAQDLDDDLSDYCVKAVAGSWWRGLFKSSEIHELYVKLRKLPSDVVRRIVDTKDHKLVLAEYRDEQRRAAASRKGHARLIRKRQVREKKAKARAAKKAPRRRK